MAKTHSLKIADIRAKLDDAAPDDVRFVVWSSQAAPFSLIGLVADGRNYLSQALPVQPGQNTISVPLLPPPNAGSEVWWAVLAGVAIPGLATVLVAGNTKRLLGRKGSVARADVWTSSAIF